MTVNDDGNQKITIAVLGTRMDNMDKKLDDIILALKDIHAIDNRVTAVETRVNNICEDVKSLEKKSNIWDGINVVLIAIGTMLGITK